MAPKQAWVRVWDREARRAILWLPVLMGFGIWAYFAIGTEPPWWTTQVVLAPLAALLMPGFRRLGWGALAAGLALTAMAAGYGLAVGHAHRVDAPMLSWPMSETVEGRVRELSRSRSGAPRVLLDEVTIYGLEPDEWPATVRISLVDTDPLVAPRPGDWVRVYARLMPPGGPVEPGAYDFRRNAFFQRLGAVGYAQGFAEVLPEPEPPALLDAVGLGIARFRQELADGLRARLPGAQGAFAAAIVTGDRAGIDERDAEALRISNLAHLLAISGLHMGILTGLVFAIARLLLAALPALSLRYPVKKWAAVIALMAGAGYLALSGATVATQRAFIMVAVAFTAVLMDRPAVTLRALALAAVIVLAIRPVSLMDVGFQMSFAATAALVAGYEALRDWQLRRVDRDRRREKRGLAARIGRAAALYSGGLVMTSLLAGLATAPYAAYHFNRTGTYGLAANLGAVPVMGLWIAPMAIAAAVLAPFGLAQPALDLMGAGIGAVLAVAHTVAGWEGAARYVHAAPQEVLWLVSLGGVWAVIWRGPWRALGAVPLALGIVVWATAPPRPELLVADSGRLIGLMGPEGRVLDRARGEGFVAENWLRRDGDGATQEEAAARPGMETGRGWSRTTLSNGWAVEVVRSNRPKEDVLAELCQPRTLLIAGGARGEVPGKCVLIGRDELRAGGALAIDAAGQGIAIRTARGGARRLWSPAD